MWSLSLSNISLHKFNAFSILTKLLLCSVAITLAVWGATAKQVWISFSFFTISWIQDLFLLEILATSAYDFFLFLSSPELSPFHLKEALNGFSLAYPYWQHHNSCALGSVIKWNEGYLNTGTTILQQSTW